MSWNNDDLTVFTKPWFDGAPQNAVKASNTLTMASTPVALNTITIGTNIYEAVANGGSVSDSDYINVELATTPATDSFVVALTEAINSNEALITATASTPNDTVALEYDKVGTEGNAVVTTETMTNGSFAEDTLTGGQYATPCRTKGIIEISGTKYLTSGAVDKWDETGWYTLTETGS